MNFKTVQEYAKHNGLTPLTKITHSTGAEIFIAEKYANSDPEYAKPHFQTWYHVAFGEDKPLAGRKLFFRFGMQSSKQSRIRAATDDAEMLIREVIDGYRREHA